MSSQHPGPASRTCAALLLAAVVEPSVSVAEKYLGTAGVVLLVILGAILAVFLPRCAAWWVAKLSVRGADLCALFAVVVVLAVTLVIYPKANVHTPMHGSDRDEALLDATSALLRGQYPYSKPTYLGNPITPLPGALILAVPFVLAGNVALANVFWSGALFLALRWWLGNSRPALLVLTLALVSPEVMHEIATGGDMFANGVYVAIFVLLVVMIVPQRHSHPLVKACAVALLGLGLSSRPTYPILLPALFQHLRILVGFRAAAGWVLLSIIVLIGVTAPFYLVSPSQFAPFDLTTKLVMADASIPYAEIVVPAFTVAVSLAFLALPLETPRTVMVAAGVIVGLPTYMLVVAYLAGGSPPPALQYFAAGLSATGLYVAALGGYLASQRTHAVPGDVTASSGQGKRS